MTINNYHCDYCQEQELKEYLINSLGDVFCSKHCKKQMQQFYKGEYEIIDRIKHYKSKENQEKEVNNE
jgi:endogenous inhibitor of DNA gyrase (YacG/DUF329 family)